VQLLVLVGGVVMLLPNFVDTIVATAFQAPTMLKLVIEITVFCIAMALKAGGLLILLLVPAWVGLIYFMAKRSREGYYVDVSDRGVFVGSPVDRFFLKKEDIRKIKPAPFFPSIPSIRIYSGRRRIIIRKLVAAQRIPDKKPLFAWFASAAPSRAEIRDGMTRLKKSLETLAGR